MPTVLFACRQNAGRSQIAQAIARQLASSPEFSAYNIQVLSAGTTPAEHIHPPVLTLLQKRHLTPEHSIPQQLSIDTVKECNWIITMGCGEECPYYPGKHYEDWPVADPAHASNQEVEAIWDDIEWRVRNLFARIRVSSVAVKGTPTSFS